ncbi:MAG: class I mannose-6-phosphate isomerase [Flavobacteriales bacterium]|nr:class I mannose-6-phosphate isomerase [Flavobacteriales bacterium]
MTDLYPLRFAPIYQYRIWGGRRLAHLLSDPLPPDDPIGEAWLLSDRKDHASIIANGAFKGSTLSEILAQAPEQLMGEATGRFQRFPLLLKFLDAQDTLSVQVHPSDTQVDYLPSGESGKTEAWVVLEAGKDARVYAGLVPGSDLDTLQSALANGTIADQLAYFTPKPGDAILIPAGTVHTMRDVVVFEVQENSDVTFRLFDWDHVDPKTGKPRPLQVEQAMACIDLAQGAKAPTLPVVEERDPLRELLFNSDHFRLWRVQSDIPFTVGESRRPRVLVCLSGNGFVEHDAVPHAIGKGDVMLLPAIVGECTCRPQVSMRILELALPERS